MKRTWRALGMVSALAISCALNGCQTVPLNSGNINAPATATPSPATSTTVPASSPTPKTSAANNTRVNELPVTLPVLDALLVDEKFADELKSKLQLSDEQIKRLRDAAREETSGLREDSADAYNDTTADSATRAATRIREIVGEGKTNQLLALARDRWNSGEEDTANNNTNTPNSSVAVPGNASASDVINAVPTDTRIVVNAPAYRMDVYDSGKLIKTYKVGIGYPEFPLPTGLRKAKTIIFNPTWTPPDEPWVEAGKSKVKVGEKIEAGSKLNPLGPIKIPIGLPSLIHGGKSPAKLGGFASHGCVGLTTPQIQDFVQVLARLSGTTLTGADVAQYAKNKTETKDVKLNQSIPVELRYETIVVEDGKLHVYRDVYSYATNTEENLRAVLQNYGVSFDALDERARAQALAALKQMARDATGKPTDDQGKTAPPNTSDKKGKDENARVTRTIKGPKEVVVEIAALKGKGYPAPVDLDAGKGAPTNKPAVQTRSKRAAS